MGIAESLRAAITMRALKQAIEQAVAMKGNESLKGLVHHSDRGIQYCCDAYVKMLQDHDISISMTEDYKPTDNAVAERINGIIKTERIYRQSHFNNINHARNVIDRYIHFYNNYRPHMSIGYKTPAQVHLEEGEQKRMWKQVKYTKIFSSNEENAVSLQSQTTTPGESVSGTLSCKNSTTFA